MDELIIHKAEWRLGEGGVLGYLGEGAGYTGDGVLCGNYMHKKPVLLALQTKEFQ